MTLRGRLIALAVATALLLTGVMIALVRSQSSGCTVAAPRPSLTAQLRALGDFDQAYDPANPAVLDEAAQRAAAVLHPDMIGATAETAVPETATDPGAPSALVVPLRAQPTATHAAPPLAGLVVFLLDCQGNAYFAAVEDDSTASPPLTAYPPVGRDQAVARLGTSSLHLAYGVDPLHPWWVGTAAPAASLAAR